MKLMREYLVFPTMPLNEYSDDCPDCMPAILDVQTGETLPDTDPMMIAAIKAFKEKTSYAERLAWHRVTIRNSRDPKDIAIMEKIAGLIQKAMEEASE